MVAQDLDRSKPIVIVNVDTAPAHRLIAKIKSKRMFDQLMNVVSRLKIKNEITPKIIIINFVTQLF